MPRACQRTAGRLPRRRDRTAILAFRWLHVGRRPLDSRNLFVTEAKYTHIKSDLLLLPDVKLNTPPRDSFSMVCINFGTDLIELTHKFSSTGGCNLIVVEEFGRALGSCDTVTFGRYSNKPCIHGYIYAYVREHTMDSS
ncbi:hypothetical protein P691DRAFT_459882 [Macrolepiota fuliginosa MF-IS2]|uniref:Uncharacterized protein n=1 Tax=Macrolepiota fuliginosa MF-IS2 TaxID=1400762 RepID=A0A9P5X350_9AGAR|nr:hypothetical protein P691DRAFT_459882 [Macrolepiota fuliginosa MF-IS2]